jgi:hypothetical protein
VILGWDAVPRQEHRDMLHSRIALSSDHGHCAALLLQQVPTPGCEHRDDVIAKFRDLGHELHHRRTRDFEHQGVCSRAGWCGRGPGVEEVQFAEELTGADRAGDQRLSGERLDDVDDPSSTRRKRSMR